jgi:hypothetical protein
MRLPTANPITLPFGSADSPYSTTNRHKGTDFGHNPDINVYAPADGTVTYVPNNGNDGNGLYYTAEGVQIGLLHLSKSFVGSGDTVKAGQKIAVMGETGAAQGVHLHWAVKRNGQFIDPMSLIKGDDMSTDAVTPEENDLLGWLATGTPGQSHPVFKNNVGNPLLTVLKNYQGYSETTNLHLDAEAYRAGATAQPKVVVNDKNYVPEK